MLTEKCILLLLMGLYCQVINATNTIAMSIHLYHHTYYDQ